MRGSCMKDVEELQEHASPLKRTAVSSGSDLIGPSDNQLDELGTR